MEHFLSAAHSFIKVFCDGVDIKGCMVGENIHNHLYIVFGGGIHHLFHLISGADNIVADFPICGLIIIIPVTFGHILIENFLAAALGSETILDRGGLHHGEAGIGDVLHVRSDLRKAPAPGMKDSLFVDGIGIDSHPVFCRGLQT